MNAYLAYATQLGNSKAIAEQLIESISSSIDIHLICISEIEKSIFLKDINILIVIGATTGDGDPPDTARKFWKHLHMKCKEKKNLNTYLSHVQYTVLGLGDTNYSNFCNFGKTIDKKLHLLGAKRFYDCGWADDGTGLEVVVEPWTENIVKVLKNLVKTTLIVSKKVEEKESKDPIKMEHQQVIMPCNIKPLSCMESVNTLLGDKVEKLKDYDLLKLSFDKECKLTVPISLPSFLKIEFSDEFKIVDVNSIQNGYLLPSAKSSVLSAKLKGWRQLTREESLKKCIEVSLELPLESESISYEPGDSFGIISRNTDSEVKCLLELLDLCDIADKTYKISIDSDSKKKNPIIPGFIPPVGTIRHTLTYCLDIRTIPKKPFLRVLCNFTKDDLEKQRLMELVSREGANEYNEKIRASGITLIDILLLFPTCKPDITTIFEHCPRLIPRSYSIASSPLVDSNFITFAFNVIEIPSDDLLTFDRLGICTGWLEDICKKNVNAQDSTLEETLENLTLKEQSPEDIFIYFRNNTTFRLPSDLETPIIMIGPGTGVAPFIGFLYHRQCLQRDKSLGYSWLFYGCRNEQYDFIYRKEIENFLSNGVLNKLSVSYSRDDPNSSEKYVQHKILKFWNEIGELIDNKKATVYVCGDAVNMAREVLDAFIEVIQKYKDISNSEAKSYVTDMQLCKRYLQDVWT